LILVAGLLGLRRDRRVALLWLAAIADIVVLGVITDAQSRYIFVGTALLVILGTETIRRAIAAQTPRVRTVLGAFAIAAVVGGWLSVTRGSLKHRARRTVSNRAWLAAAAMIQLDARGTVCRLSGDRFSQLEWYTGCSCIVPLAEAFARGVPTYVVSDTAERFTGMPGRHRILLDVPGLVHVGRLDAP
jgi:hypothetical protein